MWSFSPRKPGKKHCFSFHDPNWAKCQICDQKQECEKESKKWASLELPQDTSGKDRPPKETSKHSLVPIGDNRTDIEIGEIKDYWDTKCHKHVKVYRPEKDLYVGLHRTVAYVSRDPKDEKTLTDILYSGFGAKARLERLQNALTTISKHENLSFAAIFLTDPDDDISIVPDLRLEKRLEDTSKALEEADNDKKHTINRKASLGYCKTELPELEKRIDTLERKMIHLKEEKHKLENAVLAQKSASEDIKKKTMRMSLYFDFIGKQVRAASFQELMQGLRDEYSDTNKKIKAKLAAHGIGVEIVEDPRIAAMIQFPPMLNPDNWKGIETPLAIGARKTLKKHVLHYLSEDVSKHGYKIGKNLAPAIVYTTLFKMALDRRKNENQEQIHVPNPTRFKVKPSDKKIFLGHAVKSVTGRKTTSIPVSIPTDALLRSATVFGLQGYGKSNLLAKIAHEAALNGVATLVIDPHGTLTGVYKKLEDSNLKNLLKKKGIPIDNAIPAEGKIYGVLTNKAIPYKTRLFSPPAPRDVSPQHAETITREYVREIFTKMIPSITRIPATSAALAHTEAWAVRKLVSGQTLSFAQVHERIKQESESDAKKFERMYTLAPILDAKDPVKTEDLFTPGQVTTILLDDLNKIAMDRQSAHNLMEIVFTAILREIFKASHHSFTETTALKRLVITDELGVRGRKTATGRQDFLELGIRELRKRGTGFVLGSQRATHAEVGARQTDLSFYFRTKLPADIKSIKNTFRNSAGGEDANDLNLLTRMPTGMVLFDGGADFYPSPFFLQLAPALCSNKGLTPKEISRHNKKYQKKDMFGEEEIVLLAIRKIREKVRPPSISDVCWVLGGQKAKWYTIIKSLERQGKIVIRKSQSHPNKTIITITGEGK